MLGSTRKMMGRPYDTITDMLLHNRMCGNIIRRHGGIVVKELGDAVMAFFKTEGEACECAIRVIRNLKMHGRGIRTKVTVASGTVWKSNTHRGDDVYGLPVNICNRMSKHAKEDCVLMREISYVYVQNWLHRDKDIRFVKVKKLGKDVDLDDFGPTPMRRIVVA